MSDYIDDFVSEYAEVRRLLIEQATQALYAIPPLMDDQRPIVLHDDYGHHRRSPLGNYVCAGPSTIAQDSPLPYMSRVEIRQQPNYGILQRRLADRGDDE